MWFLLNLGRVEEERARLEELEKSRDWLESVAWRFSKNGPIVELLIKISEGQEHPLQLSFPEYYPSTPPSISPTLEQSLSGHQYGAGGELCLELGPDNWNGDQHWAADLVESAHRLLSLESTNNTDATVTIPSRHEITQGQEHRNDAFRLVVSEAFQEALDALPVTENLRCSMSVIYHGGVIRAFIRELEAELDKDKSWKDLGIPQALHKTASWGSGLVVGQKLDDPDIASLIEPATLSDFISTLQIRDLHDAAKSNALSDIHYILVRNTGDDWKVYCRWDSGTKSLEGAIVKSDSTEFDSRHGLNSETLSQKTVAIVGLGSAGSKIAASLARSGVRKFLLVDDDLLHPCNLVRHDSDWSQVGQHKVDAAEAKLKLIHPDIEVVTRKHRLGGQESAGSAGSAVTALSRADVIIDATADPNVFNICAHVAKQSRTAIFWLEIYAGGVGGLIARAKPGEDPEPFAQRDAILNTCSKLTDEKGVAPPAQVTDYAGLYDNNFLIASDADVSVVVGYLGQMILDCLSESEPSRFPYSAYLIGMARGWIFDQAMQVFPIESVASGEWYSNDNIDDPNIGKGREFMIKLCEEFSQNDNSSNSE